MPVTVTLDILTSPLLDGVRHGFFARRGGASSGIFEGLNRGGGSSDQSEIVAMNRDRVVDAMGVSPDRLVTVHQVHSAQAVTLDAPLVDRPRADAIVTATPGLAIAVLTADRQPVLFADREAGVIAAAHAGWRGAQDGVLEATVDAMVDMGARREAIHAVIGPSIASAGGQSFSSVSSMTTRRTAGSSSMGRMASTCSICRAMVWHDCAPLAWRQQNGRAIAPMPTPSGSIPTVARPIAARPIMGG